MKLGLKSKPPYAWKNPIERWTPEERDAIGRAFYVARGRVYENGRTETPPRPWEALTPSERKYLGEDAYMARQRYWQEHGEFPPMPPLSTAPLPPLTEPPDPITGRDVLGTLVFIILLPVVVLFLATTMDKINDPPRDYDNPPALCRHGRGDC